MPELLLSSEFAAIGRDQQLRTWFSQGAVRRVVRGVYARTNEVDRLSADDLYRLRVAATALLFPEAQFSHYSAAALWRLPILGRWPERAHAAAPRTAGGRSSALLVRHGFGLDPRAQTIDGVTVTSLARTLADIAGQPSLARAVVMLDDGLRVHGPGEFRRGMSAPTKVDVHEELQRFGRFPGHARARNALVLADGLSGSPGESLSRMQMRALGLPVPELQVPFYDLDGLIGVTDFYWRDLDLAGEFDGASKYGDARRHSPHLSPEEVVLAEKAREDRLRQVVGGVVRWGWSTASDRRALGALLGRHGVTPRRV